MARISDRLKHAWNAFTNQGNALDEVSYGPVSYGGSPSRTRMRFSNERSIISSIYTRLSIDVSGVAIKHVQLDDDGRYIEDVYSGLQSCLTVEPNQDQGPRQFRQDITMTLFDKGVLAIVPVDTSISPTEAGSFDIKSMRVGVITQWYPRHVKVEIFNEKNGKRQEVVLPKSTIAIVENPLYSVMNEPNSTLQRLIRKLNLLDAVDEASGSGKLDLIIQLPYVVKSEARKQQAQQRAADIEFQLKGSQYGIAYTDGTEKITQLNRPAENNLMAQIEYLTKMLYSQLGLTEEVMNGTADEATMLNYMNRTIVPILDAIVEAMTRSFLTKTARTQNKAIMYFHDPFKLVPIGQIAEIADKFIRNEVLTKNELRVILGFKPSKDKGADKLSNPNMPTQAPPTDPNNPTDPTQQNTDGTPSSQNGKGNSQNGS